MDYFNKIFAVIGSVCFFITYAVAQPDNGLQQLSLEDLLNLKVEASSLSQAQSLRETPNIVSVITREEIQAIGARNLIDVLQLVPGITFAQDIQNNVGIGMRGIWSIEAKVLILLDGQMMNDLSFLIAQFENNYYIDQIQRIEVIRGPGSTAYSNVAGTGVINIITHKETPNTRASVTGSLGADQHTTYRRTAGLSISRAFSPTKYYSMHGFLGNGTLSNLLHEGISPNDTLHQPTLGSLANAQQYTNMKFRTGGLFGNFIYSDNMQACQSFGFQTWSKPYQFHYKHAIGDIHYEWQLSDHWQLTPRFTARYGSSYEGNEAPAAADTANTYGKVLWGNNPVNQYNASIEARYTPTAKWEIVSGVSYQDATMRYDVGAGAGIKTYQGKDRLHFSLLGAYSNVLVKLSQVNIVGGIKIDRHSQFGVMAAPRIALTRMREKWHFKAQYAEAYRFPALRGFDLANQYPYFRQQEILSTSVSKYVNQWQNTRLVPERLQTIEVEGGLFMGKNIAATANLSYNVIKAPIVYVVDSMGRQTYYNHPYYGTFGAETEVRYRNKWGYVTASYTQYLPQRQRKSGDRSVEEYNAISDPDSVGIRGLPESKFVLSGAYYVSPKLTLFASAISYGETWVITKGTNPFNVSEEAQRVFVVNATLSRKDFLTDGLDVTLGAYNILGGHYDLGQAYPAGDRPIHYNPSQVMLKVSYRFAEE